MEVTVTGPRIMDHGILQDHSTGGISFSSIVPEDRRNVLKRRSHHHQEQDFAKEPEAEIPVVKVTGTTGVRINEVDEGQPCLACQEKCPGFSVHPWRNTCRVCKCPREIHDLYHEDFVNVRDRLGWEAPEDPSQVVTKEQTLREGYTWIPAGLSSEKIEEYMDQLDNNKIPRVGTPGEKYRDIQLIVQLPKQDLAEDYCKQLQNPSQRKSFEEFKTMRDSTAMDIACINHISEDMTCRNCDGEIEAGDMAVFAPKVGDNLCWHPACFVCSTCEELLVDMTYCQKDGALYCERHYAELIKPRCAACDEWRGEECDPAEVPRGRYRRGSVSHSWRETELNSAPSSSESPARDLPEVPSTIHTPETDLREDIPQELSNLSQQSPHKALGDKYWLIFSGEYTKAMDNDWHSGHFACKNCDKSLTGHRYILRDEQPYCIQCYEQLFANNCEECKTPIGTDSKDLSYKDKHWHEKCFKCCDCQSSLVDQPFASKEEKLYCANCHDNNFAARCDGCQDIFRAGMKKYEYKGKQWHEQCFCCKVCQQPISNKSFIPREQEVVCVPCYEEQYAQRCMKCNGVINKGGITYKSTPWHRDCFTCTNCNKILSGEKFTSREEKPYCADCFGDLFAKKCCRCTQPITGLGGTKFISFEDRHWHSDCFVCYKCNVLLVGRGFLTDGQDILCPDCGRA